MKPADDLAFAALARKISAGVGLTLDVYKDKCIRRRIAVRMRACGIDSYADYGSMLDRSPDELARLRETLTINVTRFYRNPETWRVLRETIIPALCAREPGKLRVWSAGCASGEEAYTAAMLFAEYFGERGCPDRFTAVRIDATDVDRASLERARAGIYGSTALTEMPKPYVERYLVPVPGGHQVSPPIRERVRIGYHDLSQPAVPRRNYHLILCRNVLIYFDRPTQDELFARLADALAPAGYLVLGKVETLLGSARGRFAVVDGRERIFQRQS